jgi:hypothetical protein
MRSRLSASQDIRKFARIEAITIGYRYLRLQPDFSVAAAALDMNMWRLRRLAFVGKK